MALEIAKEDAKFLAFQKKVFDSCNEKISKGCEIAADLPDLDLKSHLEQLEAMDLKGNEFSHVPLKDVKQDFVEDLLQRYL